jgi:hypothetical protein
VAAAAEVDLIQNDALKLLDVAELGWTTSGF